MVHSVRHEHSTCVRYLAQPSASWKEVEMSVVRRAQDCHVGWDGGERIDNLFPSYSHPESPILHQPPTTLAALRLAFRPTTLAFLFAICATTDPQTPPTATSSVMMPQVVRTLPMLLAKLYS